MKQKTETSSYIQNNWRIAVDFHDHSYIFSMYECRAIHVLIISVLVLLQSHLSLVAVPACEVVADAIIMVVICLS